MTLISRILGSKSVALRDEVAALIAELGEPLSDAEARDGWNLELKRKWHTWFTSLDEQLAAGAEPPPISHHDYISTARAMDFDGVGRTKLSRLAGRIDMRLNGGERYG